MARRLYECDRCGAPAGCDCGASPILRAQKAIAENPGRSNRAIASEAGVSEGTVRNAKAAGAQGYAPETVTGLDGKEYPTKGKGKAPSGPTYDDVMKRMNTFHRVVFTLQDTIQNDSPAKALEYLAALYEKGEGQGVELQQAVIRLRDWLDAVANGMTPYIVTCAAPKRRR